MFVYGLSLLPTFARVSWLASYVTGSGAAAAKLVLILVFCVMANAVCVVPACLVSISFLLSLRCAGGCLARPAAHRLEAAQRLAKSKCFKRLRV